MANRDSSHRRGRRASQMSACPRSCAPAPVAEIVQQPEGTREGSKTAPLSSNAAGNTELEQFVCQYNSPLINYACRFVRTRADAMDIVNEAYYRILRRHDSTNVSHLRAYLFKTTKNIATDWARQRIVREAFAAEESLRIAREASSPEEIWLAREELAELRKKFDALPTRSKMGVLMVKEDELSYEEAGARLGIKTHSARRLVERAMVYLTDSALPRHRKSRGAVTPS